MPTYTAAEKKKYAAKMAKARAARRPTYRGTGGYWQDFKRGVPKGVSSALGTGLGTGLGSLLGPAGGTAGGIMGGLLGQKFADITGLGSYSINSIKKNTLIHPQVPKISNPISGDYVEFSHHEYVGTVNSSVAFNREWVIDINPGLSQSFPWLSTLANSFTSWQMMGAAVHFKSTSAQALNSTNTALGEIFMAANYNNSPSEPSYDSKEQIMQTEWSTSGPPSQNQTLFLECDPKQNGRSVLHTRSGTVADRQDFDLCRVTVAAQGSQADAIVGDLFITYQIRLMKKQLLGIPARVPSALYQLVSAADATPLGTPTLGFDNIGLTFSGNTITVPRGTRGKFFIEFFWDGDSTACTYPNITAQSNMTNVLLFTNNSASIITNNETTDKLFMKHAFMLTDASIDGSLTLGAAGTLPTNLVSAEFYLTQVNTSIDSNPV